MDKGQAGLRSSRLKIRACGVWVFWSQGPKEGARPSGKRGWGGGGSSALWRGRRVETSGDLQSDGESCRQGAPPPEPSPLGQQGAASEWGEVRWPVQVGEALPAPASASAPSSCVGSAAGIS